MIIITDYTLVYKAELKVFIVVPGPEVQVCPCCGNPLTYRDSRRRIRKREGGKKESLLIRRLYCDNCHRLHNELPDCLVPYKHYDAETISGVLDGIITPDDDDAEDYPCIQTMQRWLAWFMKNLTNIDGFLRRAGYDILNMPKEILSCAGSVLDQIRAGCQNWLEITLRIIYNSGGFLASGW